MVIISTSATEVSIHAVSPVLSALAAGAAPAAGAAASGVCCASAATVHRNVTGAASKVRFRNTPIDSIPPKTPAWMRQHADSVRDVGPAAVATAPKNRANPLGRQLLYGVDRNRAPIVCSPGGRSEEHTSELQSHHDIECRLLLEKKKKKKTQQNRMKKTEKKEKKVEKREKK